MSLNQPYVDPVFKIKIAVDTQLLAYLIDDSYPSFTRFFKNLTNSPFVDIVCSRFVTYEYIGIRKLEHYLRTLYKSTKGNMNFSSALKYRNEFKAPELDYSECYSDIKNTIEEELKKLNDDFEIIYDENILHQALWLPHQDLVLSSRLSKEDSLVLLSSVYPQEFLKEEHTIFLTNDDQFYKAFCGGGNYRMSSIDDVFQDNDLTLPETSNIKKIKSPSGATTHNLTGDIEDDVIDDFAQDFIFNEIAKKNKKLLLGTTIRCECSEVLKKKLLCFDLADDVELPEEIYSVILYRTDSAINIYIHHTALTNFHQGDKINDFPYKATEDPKSKQITLKLSNEEGSDLKESLMDEITKKDNLVFIHPDNI